MHGWLILVIITWFNEDADISCQLECYRSATRVTANYPESFEAETYYLLSPIHLEFYLKIYVKFSSVDVVTALIT